MSYKGEFADYDNIPPVREKLCPQSFRENIYIYMRVFVFVFFLLFCLELALGKLSCQSMFIVSK